MATRRKRNQHSKRDTLKKLNKDHIKCREESKDIEKEFLLKNIKNKDFDNTAINVFFCKCNNDDYKTKSVMVEIALADISKINYNTKDMVRLSDLKEFSNVTNNLLSQKDVSMKNIHEYIIQLFFLNRNIYVQLVKKQGKGQDADAYNCNKGIVLKKELIIEPEPVVEEESEPVVEEESEPVVEKEPEPVVEEESEPVVEEESEPVVEKEPEPVVEEESEPVVEEEPEPVIEEEPEPVVEEEPEPVAEPESQVIEEDSNDFFFEESPEEKSSSEIQNENEETFMKDSPGIQSSREGDDLENEDVDEFSSQSENEADETNSIDNNTDIDTEPADVKAFRIKGSLLNITKEAIALVDNASKNIETVPGRKQQAEIKKIINKEVNEIYSKDELLTQFASNQFIDDLLNDAEADVKAEELIFIMEKIICNVGKVDLNLSNKVLKDFQIVLEKLNEEPELLKLAVDNFVGREIEFPKDDLRRPENFPDCLPENEGAGKKTRRKKIKKKQRKNKTKRNKK